MTQTIPAEAARLSRLTVLQYGVASLGTGLYSSVPAILLLFYMTDVLGVPAGWAALGIFLPKFVGALCDPLAGVGSDRTRHRLGRRFPWMFLGGAGLAVSFCLLFAGPSMVNVTGRWLFVVAVYLASAVCYSAFAVPYLAMPAEITASHVERTRIIACRMVFMMAGIMLGSAGAPAMVGLFGGGVEGYRYMGLVIGALSLLVLLCGAQLALRYREIHSGSTHETGFILQVRRVLGQRAFLLLLLVFALQTIAAGIFSALLPYIVRWKFGAAESSLAVLMFTLLLASMLSMPLWHRFASSVGKRLAFMVASAGHALGMLLLAFAATAELGLRINLLFVWLGVCFAGLQLLPFAMASDEIHDQARSTGLRGEGAYTGVWTASEKLGLALGAPLAALVLWMSGYIESAGAPVSQSQATVDAIWSGFILLPVLVQGLSIAILRRYRELERRAVPAVVDAA